MTYTPVFSEYPILMLSGNLALYSVNGLFIGETCQRDTVSHYFYNRSAISMNKISNVKSVLLVIYL
ncbi:MAG: hypothetical protein NVSMB27_14470 [Ktedonobacteraceae bacterium]